MIKELRIISSPVSISQFNLNRLEENDPQILIACPEPPPEAVKADRAIAVPLGEFSVDVILDNLPNGFYPDLIQMSARNMSFIPRGLEKFKCPKVMKIGDTFHLGDGSLTSIVEYCKLFQCDYHWVYQGVQHLHFFVEAGLKNVFWLPGTPVIDHYIPQQHESKSYDIVFRGSQSELHVYRSRLLKFLQDSSINIDVSRKPYIECLEDYTKSRIVFNCGLNSDSNRRIFEVLMAGGFLLTDRLSPQSGLFSLFQEGVDLECYGDENELLQKIDYYLNHPEKAEQIAFSGHRKLIDCYSQQAVWQKFYRYILQGEIEAPFRLEHDRRVLHINQPRNEKVFDIRIKVYELIQEIHRLNSRIKLLYWKGTNKELLSDLADLPRLDITYANTSEVLVDVEHWCNKVGVKEQVTLKLLPSENKDLSQFQIIMIDLPDSLAAIKKFWEEVEPTIAESGFLLIVGKSTIWTKERINALFKRHSLLPVNLCFENSSRELGVGACLIYQKVTKTSPITPVLNSTTKLFVTKLNFKAKIKNKLYLLPSISRTNKFIKNL
ncbi:MAG: glycosyltransferase [Nostocales cyanobacterium 94392]|nr:glycosyltransferase [Nostocales cyanobacterium 94392]